MGAEWGLKGILNGGWSMSLRIVIICAIGLMVLSIAQAQSVTFQQGQSVSIPTQVIKKPAADLLDLQGQPLEPGQAAALAQTGFDLSQLNPANNNFWQNQKYSASDASQRFYPTSTPGVRFLSFEAEIPEAFTAMMRVQSVEKPGEYFRLSLSRFSRTAMMRAALLRKLGFFIPSPKHYRDLRVQFADEEEKQLFLDSAQSTMTTDFESRGWIVEDDKKNHTVVFADAILEPAQNEYFDIHWGFAPSPYVPEQLAMVQRYSKYRAYRGLILPFELINVPESINRYNPKFGSVLSGFIVINNPAAASFSAVTIEDMKWLIRRMGEFTAQDYKEIVDEGKFPEELQDLVLAKLLYRSANVFELFGMKPAVAIQKPSLDITTASGLVVHGKVMKELVPGYPHRFAHGDRESPFKDGDFGRYLNIRGKTALLSSALKEVVNKLQLLTTDEALNERRQELQDRLINHIRNHPNEPLYQKVEAWGGPLAGMNVTATRHVSTGTYYGSTAAIQLVDNMSVAANMGFFMALDGVPKITPLGGANMSFQRDFTHVRPILSIQEGTKVTWKNVVIPKFMSHLGEILKSDDYIQGEKPEDPKRHPLDAFLSDMREGEVFTVTDSVTLAAYSQMSSSLDVLMGISPLNFLNSVALGADGSRVTLQQTAFVRTSQGIQVFVRSQKGTLLGATLDVNYFINIMKIRAQSQKSDIKTDAFVIDYTPNEGLVTEPHPDVEDSEEVTAIREKQSRIRRMLYALFKNNETEPLYEGFEYQKFDIDHKLSTKETRVKLLFLKADSFTEDHWLQLKYPKNPDYPDLNPEDEKVVLYRRKKGELIGRDFLGLATDTLEALLNKKTETTWDLSASTDPNPANIPFGKAYWKIITTEGDLSPNREQLPTVSILQKVWGGWHLSSQKFLKLIDEISAPFEKAGTGTYRLIEKEAFMNVKAIDFYRITAQLSVLPTGVDRIRDLLLQPETDSKTPQKAKFLSGLFQKLSEKLSGVKARSNEKEMFDDMMTIMGNGDASAGLKQYNQQCAREKTDHRAGSATTAGIWIHGTYFECLTSWLNKLMTLAAQYPADKEGQVRWSTEVLYILDEQIPLPQILKFLEEKNYIFFVRINGFRTGDEDGDTEYFSNTFGDPEENSEYANGLVNLFANKTRITPVELDRTQGGFR